MANENEGMQLDPELWQGLLPEIMERVIAKLPFARVIAFRRVCKKWCSDIIPRAAPHLEASSRSALVYFDHYREEADEENEEDEVDDEDEGPLGCAWWSQVCITTSESSGSIEEFQSKSFPVHKSGEDVKLLSCERGLLFFGFVCRDTYMVRDIIVCNPLISKSKNLGLPRRLQEPLRFTYSRWPSVLGITFDFETGSYYRLVFAGLDETGQDVTFVYDSLTNAWRNSSSLLSLLRAEELGPVDEWGFVDGRSSSCNGNLYWSARGYLLDGSSHEFVLKFDNQHDTWSLIPHLIAHCDDNILGMSLIAASNGEILLWHWHLDPLECEDVCESPPELLSRDHLDPDDVLPPQYIDWPCRSHSNMGMAPEIKLMPHYVMEKIYRFLLKIENWSTYHHVAFSEGNLIYHVLQTSCEDGEDLLVLEQDTDKNSLTELPRVPHGRIPLIEPENVWSFSASLTSLP